MLDAARTAYMAGICVVPPKQDGTKTPIDAWKEYQADRPTPEQMRAWYGEEGARSGIGFVCGAVSGNLELFEFDDRATYDAFVAAAAETGLGDLVARVEAGYLEDTPGGGVHWFYRCDQVAGNKTLARRPTEAHEARSTRDAVRPLIQTRGEGGYAVVAPSNGAVHPSGRAYRLVAGGPDRIATIAPAERAELWRLARTFDRVPRRVVPVQSPAAGGDGDWLERPGDAYAARTDWADVLEPHGWVRVFEAGGETYWRRPGKDRGWSATTNHGGHGMFYVFTSSTVFDDERGYAKFTAYAILNHGGDFTRAAAALAEAGYGRKAGAPAGPAATTVPMTDIGNAERLVARHGQDVRWCDAMGRWFHWTGTRWAQVGQTILQDLAKDTIAALYAEAEGTTDPEQRVALTRWAKASSSGRAVASMIGLTKTVMGPIAVDADDLDADPMLLGVENGVVDLRTGLWRPSERSDLISKSCRVPFDPEAVCPLWEGFLGRVFGGDGELVGYVRRAVGYSLTGKIGERVIFIAHGSGANGKTTFQEVLAHILGTYATSTPVETLIYRKDRGIPNDVARLKSARFVSATETEQGAKLAEAFIKAVTGGDRVQARFLHQEFFEFIPQLKLWLATNHRPTIASGGKAIWTRVRLVPFEVEIPPAERDPDLKMKLLAEAPGILAWAVRGCLDWQRTGLKEPASIRAANAAYEEDEDVLGAFLEDRAVVQPNVWCAATELYTEFVSWADAHGEERVSIKTFSQALVERTGIRRKRQAGSGSRGFSGVRLYSKNDQEDGLR